MGRLCLTLCCLAWGAMAAADDWPQWMGPRRDNVWRETGLLTKFPQGGPKVLWRVPVAGGYAGPSVAGKLRVGSERQVFVTDYVTKDNVKIDNFDRKLLTYALGRTLLLSDEPLLDEMRRALQADGYRFSALVETIVASPQFLNRRSAVTREQRGG